MNTSETSDLSLATKVTLFFEMPFNIFGNILCLIIIHYEHFGGDPMKRSLVNKFISALVGAMVFASFLSTLTLFIKVFYDFPFVVAYISVNLQIFGVILMCMNVIVIFAFKTLQILSFSAANSFDEELWFAIVEVISLLVSAGITALEVMTATGPMPLALAVAGEPLSKSKSLVR